MKLLATVALGLALLPGILPAATIENDPYDLSVSFDGDVVNSAETATIGTISSGLIASDLLEFEVSWVDGDTFFVSGRSVSTIENLVFDLTGLNFMDGLNLASIVNVVFDPSQGGFTGFVGYTSIVGPVVAFTASSIKVTLSLIPDSAKAEQVFVDLGIAQDGEFVNVAADGVRFYFDVTARSNGVQPPAVPLPASAFMLAAAVIGLAGLRRRA